MCCSSPPRHPRLIRPRYAEGHLFGSKISDRISFKNVKNSARKYSGRHPLPFATARSQSERQPSRRKPSRWRVFRTLVSVYEHLFERAAKLHGWATPNDQQKSHHESTEGACPSKRTEPPTDVSSLFWENKRTANYESESYSPRLACFLPFSVDIRRKVTSLVFL